MMSVVHICISTALDDVPTKLLIWKFCLKEDFNVPACLVEVGDGSSREFHVVGEQYHREMVLSVKYGNPAYALGVLSGRAVSCQPHDFVYGNSSAFRRTNWSDIRDATPLSTLMSNVLWMIS